MHISDKIKNLLIEQGWKYREISDESYPYHHFSKLIEGFEETGTISITGDRVVTLNIDCSGRWFSRVDGWGHIEKDVDLRNYSDDPQGAIDAVT